MYWIWCWRRQPADYYYHASTPQARENLELSFTAEAEMVFTTLSSTGRRIFSRLPAPFETVLVDEAAQASEIAALQALAFGCRRWGGTSLATPLGAHVLY